LKLQHDETLSNFAFNLNLRRYTTEETLRTAQETMRTEQDTVLARNKDLREQLAEVWGENGHVDTMAGGSLRTSTPPALN
jgi:hypothetical protein